MVSMDRVWRRPGGVLNVETLKQLCIIVRGKHWQAYVLLQHSLPRLYDMLIYVLSASNSKNAASWEMRPASAESHPRAGAGGGHWVN